MHLEAPAHATLEDLDAILRDLWLECCGHLSAFRIQGADYSSSGSLWDVAHADGAGMDVKLDDVLTPGVKFFYEYDFGTTTELTLRLLSERQITSRGKSIRVLARNEPPFIPCDSCGKNSSRVCTECAWSGEGWLCDECARQHGCDEDMLLPVVNSPRVGMCGYTG